jgi:signal transduction histidine kinase
LGFSAIFALWLLSAYVLSRRVVEADTRVTALTTGFARGEEVLFAVRERVLLSSVLVRDAALDNTTDALASYRTRLQRIRDDVEDALDRYRPYVDSTIEREHWTRLRAEVDEYWTSLSPLLSGQVAGDAAQPFLRDTMLPKHELVLRVSEDLRVLNQDALREQQAAVTELHRAVRQRLWWISGLAVAVGLVVALLAGRYIGRLETWIRKQHGLERQHTRELQRLSAELDDARENERRSIARDLHDEIGQALMTIKLDLAVVERTGHLSGPPSAALAEARSSTELAIHTVRDLSQLLHPPMLEDFGLVATLQTFVRRFSERTGVRTELVLDRMESRIPAPLEIGAYRIVQEALTNVAKHARATSCRVYLHRLPNSLLVTIEDNGKGMDPAGDGGASPSGVGLVSIRERVSRAGGTITLESAASKGTRLTAELPLPEALPAAGDAEADSSPARIAVRG